SAANVASSWRLQAGADILFGTAVEWRLRTIHVAQSGALASWCQFVGANGGRRVGDRGIQDLASVGEAEERNHSVLIDTVAGYADRAHQLTAAIDGHASWKNLYAVLQPRIARASRSVVTRGQ